MVQLLLVNVMQVGVRGVKFNSLLNDWLFVPTDNKSTKEWSKGNKRSNGRGQRILPLCTFPAGPRKGNL